MRPHFPLKTLVKSTALLALAGFGLMSNAQAEGKLTIYCSVHNTTCEKIAQRFGEKFNVDTQFVRNGTGAVLGKIKAEKDNPQADVWYGGTIEPHLQAGNQGLLEAYRSPNQQYIMPRFKKLMDQHGQFTSVIYLMELALGTNNEKLAKQGIQPPRCFADLLNPKLKNEVQYADPRVSGTGYSLISTLVTLWGEDKAFEFLKKLDSNISQYTKSGLASANLARGEVMADISFMPVYVYEKEKGSPIEATLPCEGVGYSLGAVSIIKGARNLENAKLFMDWALDTEAQELPWRVTQGYQLPTNVNAKASPKGTDPSKLKLIDIDFDRFGSEEEAKRLIERWTKEVKGE